MSEVEVLKILAVSLGIGFLVGIERGWRSRDSKESNIPAGVRTFPLIALSGGIAGVLSQVLNPYVFLLIFVGLSSLIVSSYVLSSKELDSDKGITTEVAAMTVFLLAVLTSFGFITISVAAAVIVVGLLGFKPTLHGWIAKLEKEELIASLKLLLVGLVIVPLLPNQSYGPWEAFNPFEIGWMVLLIAFISYVGYIGVKLVGPSRGLGLTAFFGGLASSTAVTLSFTRLAKTHHSLKPILAGGILLASAIMFPRVLIEVSVTNSQLVLPILPPLGLMLMTTLALAFWLWKGRSSTHFSKETRPELKNPFELLPAIQFGALLAVIFFLSEALLHTFGEESIYPLSLLSGVVDVDAITLSLSRMSQRELPLSTALNGIIIASLSNTFFKCLFFVFVVKGEIAKKMGISLIGITTSGAIGLYFSHTLF